MLIVVEDNQMPYKFGAKSTLWGMCVWNRLESGSSDWVGGEM